MNQTSSFCDTCGASNPTASQFCHTCGQALLHDLTSTGNLPAAYLLKERYRVVKKLGQGGFGAIYLAADTQFHDALRALKEMRNRFLQPQEQRQMVAAFQQEAMLLATLMHPNLPRIYDHFEAGGRWYLVMDYIDGETLEERLTRTGRLPAREVLPLVLQLCQVLDYLHSRQPPVIFRDMKPANVMITADRHIYLIDFGIARFFKPGMAKDTLVMGTVGYAAPEQYGKAQSTVASDIYGLGATLHQLLSGEDPSEHPFTFSRLKRDQAQDGLAVSRLSDLVQQMVQIPMESRPNSIQEVRQELLQIEQDLQQGNAQLPFSVQDSLVRVREPASSVPQAGKTVAILQNRDIIFYGNTISALAWLPDSRHLISGGRGELFYWDLTTLTSHRFVTSDSPYLAVSPDGKFVLAGETVGEALGAGHHLYIYSIPAYEQYWEEGKWRADCIGDHPWTPTLGVRGKELSALAWSPDGQVIAMGTENGSIYLWHVAARCFVFHCRPHIEAVKALSWSPNGNALASGSEDGFVRILVRTTRSGLFGTRKDMLKRRRSNSENDRYQWKRSTEAVAWSPDGKLIAFAGVHGLHLIDASGNLHLPSFQPSSLFSINALSWSPDGQYLATSSYDQIVRIWNLSQDTSRKYTMRCILTYTQHRNLIHTVCWSPNGKYIASCDADKTIHVWEASMLELPSQTMTSGSSPWPLSNQQHTGYDFTAW